jgi:hypothetical protein
LSLVLYAESLVFGRSSFEAEITIAKLKRYKSSGIYKFPLKLIQAVGKILRSEIHDLINSTWNNQDLADQCPFTRRAIKLTVLIIVGYHCHQLHTKFYPIFFSQD